MSEVVHVVAGVLRASNGCILVSKRPEHVHQGGLWEFPGGKLESGETPRQALFRELDEELGVQVTAARPLIRVQHAYPERTVLLDTWLVEGFAGKPIGREGQPLDWVFPQDLHPDSFPAADRAIISALKLPQECLLLDIEELPVEVRRGALSAALGGGLRLIILTGRAAGNGARSTVETCLSMCRQYGAQLIVGNDTFSSGEFEADGWHLSQAQLQGSAHQTLGQARWLTATCGNLQELRDARQQGCDFVLFAPGTSSEAAAEAESRYRGVLQELCAHAGLPVFALVSGQLSLSEAWSLGAHGLAWTACRLTD